MSFRSIVIAAFASILMLSSAGAMAQGHGGGGHGGGGHGGGFHGGGGAFHGGGFHGGGWGHSSVFIGGGFGFWPGYAYGYDPYYYDYPPVAYAPPPVAYAPPPVAYAPPPVNYAPGTYTPAPNGAVAQNQASSQAVDQSYCRQYQGTVMVEGATQPSSGVACRQPNGSWRIVQ